ncbi:MAG: outer membrane protein assembly factor BamA [Planctomycetes bacterium]|nr:outer membrane protein assembly factor BamA [Planctomycetota bacterium]
MNQPLPHTPAASLCRRLIQGWLAALLVCLTPSAGLAQEGDWSWAEGREVLDVRWEGLEQIPVADAEGLVSVRAGQTFSSRQLARDLVLLVRSGRFGPGDGGAPPARARVEEDGDGVVVVFEVGRELQRVRRVGRVPEDVVETLKTDEEPLRWEVQSGNWLSPGAVERDLNELRRRLRKRGYLYADAQVETQEFPTGADVLFRVTPGPRVYVEDIEVSYDGEEDGVLDVEDLFEIKEWKTKERGWLSFDPNSGTYDPDGFTADLDLLAGYYRSQGFLDVQISEGQRTFNLEGDEVTLRIEVSEGPRYRVRRVGIRGTRVYSEERLSYEIALRPGRPFLNDDLRESLERIRFLYGQRSYVHADIDIDMRYDAERQLVDVDLLVSEGPKVRIEEIKIRGNLDTREDVIRRELSVYPGEYFDAEEMQNSRSRLYRTRYFTEVEYSFEPGSEPGSEHLILTVVENDKLRSISFGGAVSTSAGFFGNFQLTMPNFDIFDPPNSFADVFSLQMFKGAGQTFQITYQPGRQRSALSLDFTEPWLFDRPIELGLGASLRDRAREDWIEARRIGRISLGYRITQDLIARASYRIERVFVGDVELDAVPDAVRVAGLNYVSALRLSLSINKTRVDRFFVAYGGFTAEAYYEVAGQFLGGDHDFHRAGLEGNVYFELFEFPREYRWVLALGGQVSVQRSLDGDPIPIFERFFAGGPNSIRGFQFRTVTPQLRDKPLGGDFLALLNAEFSFPMFRDILRGVAFVDGGGVTAKVRDWTREDFRLAAGFGVRIKVPVFPAPVALDFAWPILERDDDDRQVFSFSVGFGF